MQNDQQPDGMFDGGPGPRGWTRTIAIGALAVAGVAGVAIVAARGEEGGRFGFHQDGGAPMHAGFGGGRFMERGVDRVLDEVDATDKQSEKLWAILDAAQDSMRPLMRDMRGTREDIVKLLSAQTIDRAAAETLRAERVAALDQASKTMTAALLDAAEVLTPEQRAKLVEHFEERRAHRRW